MKMTPPILLFTTIVVAGCSAPLFPPSVTRDVAPVEFGVLEARPDVFRGKVVQLAGRIVGVEEGPTGTVIRAQELALRDHPVYGPAETMHPTSEFAILYPGKIEPSGLWYGNKLVVIAVAHGVQAVNVQGASRMEPYVIARCMHIWKTGGYGLYGIEDFPHTQDGYWPLEHQTYCPA